MVGTSSNGSTESGSIQAPATPVEEANPFSTNQTVPLNAVADAYTDTTEIATNLANLVAAPNSVRNPGTPVHRHQAIIRFFGELDPDDEMSIQSPAYYDGSVKYTCTGCQNRCSCTMEEVLAGVVAGHDIGVWSPVNGKPTKCMPCMVVSEAIKKLNNLVFREPWLVTEGQAGAPDREAWEEEDLSVEREDEEDEEEDGLTVEEREALRSHASEGMPVVGEK